MRPLLPTKKFRHLSAIGFAAACLSLSACDSAMITGTGDGEDTEMLIPDTGNNIVSVLQSDEDFETLVTAIDAAGLTELLSSVNDFTLFAPNDAAFDALGDGAVDALVADPESLKNILLYHVISGQSVDAATATSLAGTSVASANGATLAITQDGDALLINDATVGRADLDASNGIIHEIDTVLTPPEPTPPDEGTGDMFATIQADENFTTLTAALEATGLNTILANTNETYTLFAPNDAAFDALGTETVNALLADTDALTTILSYHLISNQAVDSATAIGLAGTSVESATGDTLAISLDGENLMINDATVTDPDGATSNGLIHEIDTVLMPPPAEVDVVATLASKPDYSTLVSLVQSADLASTLADAAKTYTIFAPTNEALAALDATLLAGLSNDQAALETLLLGHVIEDSVNSATARTLAGQNVATLSGAEWPVAVTADTLSIGGANVIEPDVSASNGIIHGIDAVLQ